MGYNRSLLQNIVSFIGLFCKRDLYFNRSSIIWLNYVTHMNESQHTYEWGTAHIWMSHSTHMNEAQHTYEWVAAHIWMRHSTHMNESRHTCEWGTAQHTYERVAAHKWILAHIQTNVDTHSEPSTPHTRAVPCLKLVWKLRGLPRKLVELSTVVFVEVSSVCGVNNSWHALWTSHTRVTCLVHNVC